MSAVLMCDNCGNLFSVNEKGWTEHTMSQSPQNGYRPRADYPNMADAAERVSFNNPHNHGAVTMHFGPCCQLSGPKVMRPRVLLAELESGLIDDVRLEKPETD